VLLVTAFATIATSCIPPLNDFKFTDDVTLIEDVIAQYDALSRNRFGACVCRHESYEAMTKGQEWHHQYRLLLA
jgi:hypothetical protein